MIDEETQKYRSDMDRLMLRGNFEEAMVERYGPYHTRPWGITERARDGNGDIKEGYLDLYTEQRWEGWKMAIQFERGL